MLLFLQGEPPPLSTPWTPYRMAGLIGSQRRRWMFRCAHSQFTALRRNVKGWKRRRPAGRVLWKSSKVKETGQGSESHDLGINGLSTARGILQRFREACQSTKRDAETRQPAGNWNLAIQVHSQRILSEFLTSSALFQPLLKGLDESQLACQVGWRTHFW